MNAVSDAGCKPSGEAEEPRTTPYPTRTTDDRCEAERLITDLYLPHRLEVPSGSAPLRMEVAGLRLGALTAGRLTYGQAVRLRTAEAQNFHVNIPLRGHALSRSGSGGRVRTGVGEGLVFSPGAPAEIAWTADCEQLCLMIPRGCLEAELEKLLGRSIRGRLSFDFAADLGSPAARRWHTVLDLLVDELDHPTGWGGNVHVGGHIEALVLDGLLLSQPHSHSDAAIGHGSVRLGSSIRHAVELMEERPAEPWTTVGLANEVHLSVRALQEGFRRDLDTPPMTYLRQVRLRRAREALQAADRDATTVGAIASGLGILHLGRFAASYREAFGESPSDTLNRAS